MTRINVVVDLFILREGSFLDALFLFGYKCYGHWSKHPAPNRPPRRVNTWIEVRETNCEQCAGGHSPFIMRIKQFSFEMFRFVLIRWFRSLSWWLKLYWNHFSSHFKVCASFCYGAKYSPNVGLKFVERSTTHEVCSTMRERQTFDDCAKVFRRKSWIYLS